MNAPLRAATFDPPAARPLARPAHLRPPAQPGADRAIGLAITLAAHVAAAIALVLGFHAAHPPVAPPPMMVAIEEKKTVQEKLDVSLPKFTPPPILSVPAPVFDIAPSPNAISAPPVRSATPAPPAPAAAPAPDAGQGRASYLGQLLAQLNRFKQYPPQARAAHIEGVVMLHFVLDRSGRLLSAEISQSSGRPALDREALALIARAQPLPAMPADMGGETLDAIVPINFSLRS